MAALESKGVKKKMVNSSINVDDLCKKSTTFMNERIEKINKAADEFKIEIKKDFLDKLQNSVNRNYRKTFLYTWKANKKPDDCSEEDEIYYKTFNNMKPFDIMNNYKKNKGKYQFMKELSHEINEEFGTETTKFYIKYEKLYDNKYVITSKFYIPKTPNPNKTNLKSNSDPETNESENKNSKSSNIKEVIYDQDNDEDDDEEEVEEEVEEEAEEEEAED